MKIEEMVGLQKSPFGKYHNNYCSEESTMPKIENKCMIENRIHTWSQSIFPEDDYKENLTSEKPTNTILTKWSKLSSPVIV